MNLDKLRTQVKNITDYSPELEAYRNQLDDLINNSYLSLWTRKRWNFASKLVPLDAYPDITSARETQGLSTISASVNDGERLVTFDANVYSLWNHKNIYEGNPIEIAGREYTILQILSETTLSVTEPIRLTASVATAVYSDWVVKAKYYTLPEDCVEILSLSHKENNEAPLHGKLQGLLPRHDDMAGLREDKTSNYAEAYVPIAPSVVTPAETTLISYTIDTGNDPTNTSLINGHTLELCWSFMSPEGQYGPLSKPLVTVVENSSGTASMTFSFATFDGQEIKSPLNSYSAGPGATRQWEGLKKVLWYNANRHRITGQEMGPPLWRQVIIGVDTGGPDAENQDDPIIGQDTQSSVTIVNSDSFRSGTKIYREHDGQHLRVRPYPRIDAFDFEYEQGPDADNKPTRERDYYRRLDLRYYYKPRPLALETDTPELPYEFHQLVVYGALEDIYNKSGNLQLGRLYAEKLERSIKGLEKRYTDRTDVFLQRGQFGTRQRRTFLDHNSLSNKSQS